jgi:hypothetical protein
MPLNVQTQQIQQGLQTQPQFTSFTIKPVPVLLATSLTNSSTNSSNEINASTNSSYINHHNFQVITDEVEGNKNFWLVQT